MNFNLYKNLPIEIIIIIINYDGRIVERRGKFLNRINTNNNKWNLIKNNLIMKSNLLNKIQIHIKYFINGDVLQSTFKNKYIIYKIIVEWLNLRKVNHPFSQNQGITCNRYSNMYYLDL